MALEQTRALDLQHGRGFLLSERVFAATPALEWQALLDRALAPSNPRGNRPRYSVVLGEVDKASGLLIRDTVNPIDDRHADDDEILMIYPIYAREDRRKGEIAVHMSR